MNWINIPQSTVSPKGDCILLMCVGAYSKPCDRFQVEPCSRKAHTR